MLGQFLGDENFTGKLVTSQFVLIHSLISYFRGKMAPDVTILNPEEKNIVESLRILIFNIAANNKDIHIVNVFLPFAHFTFFTIV